MSSNIERKKIALNLRHYGSQPSIFVRTFSAFTTLPGFDLTFLPLCVSCDARFAHLQEQQVPSPQVDSKQSTPRIWTFEHNPLQVGASQQKLATREPQVVAHSRVSVPKNMPSPPLQDESVDPWHPRDLRLLQKICVEHDVPFELMLALFQLEHRPCSPAGRTDIQAGIHSLLSQDWSHTGQAITNVQAQEATEFAIFPSSNKLKQLALW